MAAYISAGVRKVGAPATLMPRWLATAASVKFGFLAMTGRCWSSTILPTPTIATRQGLIRPPPVTRIPTDPQRFEHGRRRRATALWSQARAIDPGEYRPRPAGARTGACRNRVGGTHGRTFI